MASASPFLRTTLTLSVPLPPAYLGAELEGASAALADLLAKYHAELGGVLLAYARPRFADAPATAEAPGGGGPYLASHGGAPLGRIFEEAPFVHVRLTVDALLFKPALGAVLHGRVVSTSNGHVTALVGGLFNVLIHEEDMAGGYAYDEDAKAWVATDAHAAAVGAAAGAAADAVLDAGGKAGKKRRRGDSTAAAAAPGGAGAGYNRVLAWNPPAVRVGSHVAFSLTRLAHTQGVLQMYGSFADGNKRAPLPPPAPPAWSPGGSSNGGSGGFEELAAFEAAGRRAGGGVVVAPELAAAATVAATAGRAAAATDKDGGASSESAAGAAAGHKKRKRTASASSEGGAGASAAEAAAAAQPEHAGDAEAPADVTAADAPRDAAAKKAKKEAKERKHHHHHKKQAAEDA